jgi:peptide-methionine (R)-S-oxide reductase
MKGRFDLQQHEQGSRAGSSRVSRPGHLAGPIAHSAVKQTFFHTGHRTRFPMTKSQTKIEKADAEWQAQLSPEAYRVARKHGTERAFTSPLNNEKRDGTFNCVCCGEPLFVTADKFESGTGWPSFTQPVDKNAVGETSDNSFFMRRTEVHCAKCDAHLGHVFPDGPKPTGLRYCMNGVALTFEPKTD